MFYDEAIEVYDESDEEISPDEYANTPRPKAVSPVRKPLSSRLRQPPPLSLPQSQYRPTMSNSGEESKKLSSQDFIPTPRPTSTNHRGIDISSSLSQDQSVFGSDTPRPRNMAEMSKTSSIEKDQSPSSSGTGRKSQSQLSGSGKGASRPQSAAQPLKLPQNQKQGSSEDEDDEDYDEETNMAQVEGNFPSRITLASQRGAANAQLGVGIRDPSYSDVSDSEYEYNNTGDSDLENSEMFDDMILKSARQQSLYPYDVPEVDEYYPCGPLPHLSHVTKSGPTRRTCGGYPNFLPSEEDEYDNYGAIIDERVAIRLSPPQMEPELSDQESLEVYETQKKLWECRLDMKRMELQALHRLRRSPYGYATPEDESEAKVYNPSDYANLAVSPEIKDIFQYITQYQLPQMNSQIDVKLHPFIPEYYPSVGDIDAFIKVVDPEVTEDGLGVKCLDEPAPFQSDPSVLDLRLRALAKQSSAKAVVVKRVENVGKNTKIIENWIKDISDLHRSKPSPSVHYSKPMPDIDLLIQEWPPEVEDLLKNLTLPSPDLNCDLATYVDIVCNILDIPVYKSRIQSLHVLFTLYATQKQFNQLGPLGDGNSQGALINDSDLMPSSSGIQIREENYDRLQLS